jgi:hypothetical protein
MPRRKGPREAGCWAELIVPTRSSREDGPCSTALPDAEHEKGGSAAGPQEVGSKKGASMVPPPVDAERRRAEPDEEKEKQMDTVCGSVLLFIITYYFHMGPVLELQMFMCELNLDLYRHAPLTQMS